MTITTQHDDALRLLAQLYARWFQRTNTQPLLTVYAQIRDMLASSVSQQQAYHQLREQAQQMGPTCSVYEQAAALVQSVIEVGSADGLIVGQTDGFRHLCLTCSQDEEHFKQVRFFDHRQRRALLKPEVEGSRRSAYDRCQLCLQPINPTTFVVCAFAGTASSRHSKACTCGACNRTGISYLLGIYACEPEHQRVLFGLASGLRSGGRLRKGKTSTQQYTPIDPDLEYPIDSTAQYFRDMAAYAHLVHLPKNQERDLAERARSGDPEARERIILSCLAYVIRVASAHFRTLATHHDELLDLISVGHCALVEMLDVALTKRNCFSYLLMRVKFAIRAHCYAHSDLIGRTEGFERKRQVSLEVLQRERRFDVPIPEQELSDERRSITSHDRLYEALTRLTERQREVLIRRYGLFHQPEEHLPDIDRIDISSGRHKMALNNLRRLLADEQQ